MTRRKKKREDFEEACRRIATEKIVEGKVEQWLERLAHTEPGEAIKMWVQISEFAHAKKARDHKIPQGTTINILMQPAKRRKLEAPEDNYIDITDKQKGQNE